MRNAPPQHLQPFSCTHTPNFPEILFNLGCTLMISTYQAGKLVFVSAPNKHQLIQLPRTFKRAMGIALKGDNLAITTASEVITFVNSRELAYNYPSNPKTYDALYVPRATYYTGYLDMHDLHYGNNALWGINTAFSCLCQIGSDYSFRPMWKPHFVSQVVSGDRCHLNGLAMENGEPLYVSALGTGDSFQSWRETITTGGVVMHIPSNEIVATGLAMPHAPRMYDGKLYALLSAKEELICIDPDTGKYDVVTKLPGFVRGMVRQGDYLFIGRSKLRKESKTFQKLTISENTDTAGIIVVQLSTGAVVAKMEWLASVEEIYDVQVLPNIRRPNIINTYGEIHNQALLLPKATFWARPADKKKAPAQEKK